uniref:Uncharacterized protein n=1 Tax=Ascaris lumbricoides TaxID=6252 RepID=A0A9J2PIG3_ASCLU
MVSASMRVSVCVDWQCFHKATHQKYETLKNAEYGASECSRKCSKKVRSYSIRVSTHRSSGDGSGRAPPEGQPGDKSVRVVSE